MSACRCPHCSATGRCQCNECMLAARGESYVRQSRTNKGHLLAFAVSAQLKDPLALLFLPLALVARAQMQETYPCSVCKGRGYNHIGKRRW